MTDSLKDKAQGKAKEVGGKVTGDRSTEAEGKAQQMKGNVEGKADEVAGNMRSAGRDAERHARNEERRRTS